MLEKQFPICEINLLILKNTIDFLIFEINFLIFEINFLIF